MNFGNKIRELREKKGLSLFQVANKLGIPPVCLDEVEKGKRILGKRTMARLAQVLDVPLEVLSESQEESLKPEEDVGYISSSVGRKLRKLREDKGLTLAKLAQTSGVSYTHISEIERNHACPSLKTLGKLARALGVPVGFFLTGNGYGPLGEKVKLLREKQGLTQSELAKRIDASCSLVAQIESGKTQPSIGILERLSEALGVAPSYFLIDESQLVLPPQDLAGGNTSKDPIHIEILALLKDLNAYELAFVRDFIKLLHDHNKRQEACVIGSQHHG